MVEPIAERDPALSLCDLHFQFSASRSKRAWENVNEI